LADGAGTKAAPRKRRHLGDIVGSWMLRKLKLDTHNV
jgi:hypothetical protein